MRNNVKNRKGVCRVDIVGSICICLMGKLVTESPSIHICRKGIEIRKDFAPERPFDHPIPNLHQVQLLSRKCTLHVSDIPFFLHFPWNSDAHKHSHSFTHEGGRNPNTITLSNYTKNHLFDIDGIPA